MRAEIPCRAVAAAAAGHSVEDLGWLHPRACARARVERQEAMRVRKLMTHVLDLALPPRCPGCGATVSARDRFCVSCWADLRFIGPPWCAGCQVPFDHDDGGDRLCDSCREAPPRHAGVRAAVAYGPGPRTLALGLKYGRRAGYAATAARMMRRHLPEDAALLVPVPLHRWRLWARGYNQAGLIAASLGRETGVPVEVAAIERIRPTSSLRGLSGQARHRAVAGAFRLAPHAPRLVAGRHVVLIDDVYTSGATAGGCVDALLAGGAGKVTILTWARVLGEARMD